jgi:hypothetical protein
MREIHFVVFGKNDWPEIRSRIVDQEDIEEGFYLEFGTIYVSPEMVCNTFSQAEERLQFVKLELGIETPVYH